MNAENAVLGSVLLDASVLDEIELESSDFYDPKNARLWETLKEMQRQTAVIDLMTVSAKFPNDAEYIFRLTDSVATPEAGRYYAQLVQEDSTKRKIINLAQTLIVEANAKTGGELIDTARAGLDRLISNESDVERLPSVFSRVLEEIATPAPLIPSPFKSLNKLIGGYRNGAMYVVAARPGVGKTLFALETAFGLAENHGVLFMSMEMGSSELVKRLISSVTSVEAQKIINSQLEEADWNRIATLRSKFERNLFIQDRAAITVNNVRAAVRKANRVQPIRAVVIDYLGLMHDSRQSKSRYEKVTNISNDLKQLARELNIPIIALHQLNREIESRSDPKPTLSDLRDSGAIEQDADVVMLLHRDTENGKFMDTMKVFVSKNRHGSQGLCELRIHPAYVRVVENA